MLLGLGLQVLDQFVPSHPPCPDGVGTGTFVSTSRSGVWVGDEGSEALILRIARPGSPVAAGPRSRDRDRPAFATASRAERRPDVSATLPGPRPWPRPCGAAKTWASASDGAVVRSAGRPETVLLRPGQKVFNRGESIGVRPVNRRFGWNARGAFHLSLFRGRRRRSIGADD